RNVGVGQSQHLLLAATQRPGRLLEPFAEARERFDGALDRLTSRTLAGLQAKVVGHAQRPEDAAPFWDETDPPPVQLEGRRSGDVLAVDENLTTRRFQQTGGDAE